MSVHRIIRWGLLVAVLGIASWWLLASPLQLRASFRRDYLAAAKPAQRQVFERYYDKLGLAAMLDVLEAQFPLCHSEGHDLGKVVYSRLQDLNDAITLCRDRCSSGCFHGALMEAFQAVGKPNDDHPPGQEDVHIELDDLRDKITATCADAAVTSVHPPGRCAHGLGHALMFLADYDIPQALEFCALFDDRRMEYYCNGGAFMEYDIIYGLEDLKNGKPLHYPCDTYDEFPAACYFYRAKYLTRHLGGPLPAARECLSLPRYRRLGCWRGLALSEISVLERQPSYLAILCSHGDLDDQRACVEGAVERWSDFDTPAPRQACASLTNPELRAYCGAAADRGAFTLDKPFDLYFGPDTGAASGAPARQ